MTSCNVRYTDTLAKKPAGHFTATFLVQVENIATWLLKFPSVAGLLLATETCLCVCVHVCVAECV